ncbi:MAG: TIM-barrel domain-containing protein, partial [Kofleriaceae bacterium]
MREQHNVAPAGKQMACGPGGARDTIAVMSRWSVAVLVCALGCGHDDPPPTEVASGRLVARIAPEPAQITLLLDGAEVWSTRDGERSDGNKPPHGFAAIGSIANAIEMQFGSYRFTENTEAEVWRPIERLDDITVTATGATFTLIAGGEAIGTGELGFVTATRSGPDPDAAGFPRHVRIKLVTADAERIQIATPCRDDEHLLGLGGQSFDIDHRGETVPLWVQEDGIGKFPDADDVYSGVWFLTGRKHSTHTPMPMLLSSRGYALAIDTDGRSVFALGSEAADTSRFEAWDKTLDLQVFIGDGPRDGAIAGEAARDALGHMLAWTGKAERPPITIFAPWVDALFGSANVRRVAQKLRANGIAASAIWTEDWRGGVDGALGYELEEDWRVDRTLYPDFEQLGTDLRGNGFAFLTYHNTFIDDTADVSAEAIAGGYPIKTRDGDIYRFTGVKFNPSTLLDLSNPAAVTWAKGVMSEVIPLGSDGWMADFAEWLPHDAVLASGESALAVHNRYPVDWARMNHEMFATPLPGRPQGMWFMRSAWLHSQPHVQVLWPGDQQTDFSEGDGLPSVIPMGVNLGLAGFPYFGSDVAGYMSQGTVPTSDELFHRWVTFGALQPVMRTHHGRSARENVQWEHDAGTEAHFKRWARLHMQLATYQWGSIGSFERDGLPLMRLVALEYPGEPWAWTVIDEYLLGDRILVAPIQVAGATTRVVQLPAGDWYPLLGGTKVTGEHAATAAKTEIPAYVPAGAMLVLFPDGVDTVLDAPAVAGTVTAGEVANDREVWLYPGTSLVADHAAWNDELGPAGPAQWTWTGRPDGPPPTTATFNGVSINVTAG